MAYKGSFCNCLLPESIQITAVRHIPDHPTYFDDDILGRERRRGRGSRSSSADCTK